ncbi:endolytic transglycosylase MltG [Inediibacterium massiliense]|uniref:endolytic transglycosylase MltG n=1 Tax=Inediibacterium massiliense TaxID=1658111 RepID=UPI0006B69B8A|nr:endolytic transglycosylase MltG [Inediibacterium massiliense]
MISKIKRIIIVMLMVGVLGIVGGRFYFYQSIKPVDVQSNRETMVIIPKGASTGNIASILKEKNLIQSSYTFRLLSKWSEADGQMKAGTYLLKENMSADEIIKILSNGETAKTITKITIPEGFEFKQIVDRLEARGLIDRNKFIEMANYGDFDYPFLKEIPKGENRLEGFLFPDTYEIGKEETEREIIIKMLDRFNHVFKDEYYKRAKELNMNINEVVTLASIIEREAKLDEERTIVSSVFHNRLKKKIRLRSCATVQYVLGERKPHLTNKDTSIDSPYNTYKHDGLPPKPIASPGEASIKAALYPKDTNYLYFVVSKNGAHHFSQTYEEHLNAAKNAN